MSEPTQLSEGSRALLGRQKLTGPKLKTVPKSGWSLSKIGSTAGMNLGHLESKMRGKSAEPWTQKAWVRGSN